MDTSNIAIRPTPSVAEHLRNSFRERQGNKVESFPIAGYDGLFVTFRALDDYAEVRNAVGEVVKRRGVPEAEREIEIGIETLKLSSIGSYAMIDGQKIDIGLPLGIDLYDYIFAADPDSDDEPTHKPQTDNEAIILLFDNTMALMLLASRLDRWFKGEAVTTDEALLGE